MLKEREINYPITFNSHGVGKFTFNSSREGFKHNGGQKSPHNGTVHHFIEMSNILNPSNTKGYDYHYEMAGCNADDVAVDPMINNVSIKRDNIYSASEFTTDYRICKVEEMPFDATLKGIQDCNGEWIETTFKPCRIEVHDDFITLLSGYAGWRPKGDKVYGAEINIKRGTNVKFS